MIKRLLKIILGMLVIFVVTLIVLGSDTTKPSEITVVLDYGDGNQKVFKLRTTEEKRAWSLLQQATAISGIDLIADNDFVPVKIDGFQNGDNGRWVVYVNGEKQEVSPYEIKVSPSDKIVFKFERQ